MQKLPDFILTISCKDKIGIVSAISSFLKDNDCFITESGQWGDPIGRFFMRVVFTCEQKQTQSELQKKFQTIAEKFSMDFTLHDNSKKPNMLIMVSKQGHCLNDLLHRYASGLLNAEIKAVVSNHKDMEKMTKWYDIPFYHLPVDEKNKAKQEQKTLDIIKKHKVDLTVLARYMQVLSPDFVREIYGRAINIHHSFLPGFKGAKPYHQAYDRGVKIIGATAHYVSDDLDEGPIIEQGVAKVDHTYTPEKLVETGRDIECNVLAAAVKYHTENRVIINGNKTVVFK